MTPAGTLLAALREFLGDRVAPRLEGYAAFELRIALNLLALLEREARLGPVLHEVDRGLAKDLALREDRVAADLAVALRDGVCTADDRLREGLRQRALLSLAIDNPRYSGAQQARRRWPELARKVDARVDAAS